MGNTNLPSLLVTSNASTINHQQIAWSNQFTLLDKQPLNHTYVLHHTSTNQSYKVKHMVLNKLQHTQIFRQLNLRETSPCPFVVKVQKSQQYTVKGYCSQNQQVFVMYKYIQSNLKQQILNRRFRQEKFTQKQIKVILQAGVKGITYLYQIGSLPKGLNTSQVLITSQRAVLINDPWLSVGSRFPLANQQQNPRQQQANNFTYFPTPVQQYPSPEKILHMNDLIQEYNQWLSQLFTFGVIVLQTIFRQPLSELLYQKSLRKIHYHKVKQKIEQIQQGLQLAVQKPPGKEGYSSPLMLEKSTSVDILGEIKQDLRRLLSHEPRLRESVYLKYKKNKSEYLFLRKNTQQFKQDIQSTQHNHHLNDFNKDSTCRNNMADVNNQRERRTNNLGYLQHNQKNQPHVNLQPQNSHIAQKQLEGININFNRGQAVNNLNKLNHQIKTNSQINQNRFRVVSSSLPHGNKSQLNHEKNSLATPFTNQHVMTNTKYLKFQMVDGTMSKNNSTFHHLGRNNQNNSQNINRGIFQPYTPVQAHPLRKAELSPKKQTLVQKQKEYRPFNTTNTTYSTNLNFANLVTQKNPQFSQVKSNNLFITSDNKHTNNFSIPPTNITNKNNFNSTLKPPMVNNKSNYFTGHNINLVNSQHVYVPLQSQSQFKGQNNLIGGNNSNYHSSSGYDCYIARDKGQFDHINRDHLAATNWQYTAGGSQSMLRDCCYLNPSYRTHYQKYASLNKLQADGLDYNSSKVRYIDSTCLRNTGNYDYTALQSNRLNQNSLGSQFNYMHPLAKISLSQSFSKLPPMVAVENKTFDVVNLNLAQNNIPSGDFSTGNSCTMPQNSQGQLPQYSQGQLSQYSQEQIYSPNCFEQWKKQHGLPYSFASTSNQGTASFLSTSKQEEPQANRKNYDKNLKNYNYRQVKSINCDDSHFMNDKQSFVIQSSVGMSKLQPLGRRSQNPLGDVGSGPSGFSNLNEPKSSFEINHSIISNFRNDEGKSFSSMDEDVKQLKRFGGGSQKSLQNVDRKCGSFAGSQRSAIQKINDMGVLGSYNRASFQNSLQKDTIFNVKPLKPLTTPANANAYNPHNLNNLHLQTPQRHPNKARLNSTIRQASCQQSGLMNQSINNSYNNNNQSPQSNNKKDKVHPQTEVSKYEHMNRQYNQEKLHIVSSERRRQAQKLQRKDYTQEQEIMRFKDLNYHQGKDFNSKENSNLTQINKKINKNNDGNNNILIKTQSNETTVYQDGSKYIGQQNRDKQNHGYGILYYSDGNTAYQGYWSNGDFHGKGRLFNPYHQQMPSLYDFHNLTQMDESMQQFQGSFQNDRKQGKGKLKMHNQEIYHGEFKEDLPGGRGKYYCSSGQVVEGVWEKGYLRTKL